MGEDYLRQLASFEVALPLEHRSGLVESALALKILSLSEDTIGEISALLCRDRTDYERLARSLRVRRTLRTTACRHC
jgi:hypothetical protein